MNKIKALPKELQKLLPNIRNKWLNIALSSEPANREMAEEGVDQVYKAAGLKPPSKKIWRNSPLEGSTYASHLIRNEKVGVIVTEQLNRLVSQCLHPLRKNTEKQVLELVDKEVLDPLEQLFEQDIRESIFNVILQEPFRELNCLYGQQEVDWLAYLEIFQDFVKDKSNLLGFNLIAQSCGWVVAL